MNVEIRIDETVDEPKVLIIASSMSDEVNEIVRRLSESPLRVLAGFREDSVELVEPGRVSRAYASGGKVYAVADGHEYLLKLRLYELEERLSGCGFVRISNSELINLSHAKSFDLSLAGAICVKLADGTAAYVSRRYVAKIKQVLGI